MPESIDTLKENYMNSIRFFYQTQFYFKNRNITKQWLSLSIKDLGFEMGNITYIFCDNTFILSINKEFLQHNYPTDIITFNYNENNTINAELYISVEQVKANAITFNSSFKNELHRVLIHGVLHLTGYNDSTNKEKELMRR